MQATWKLRLIAQQWYPNKLPWGRNPWNYNCSHCLNNFICIRRSFLARMINEDHFKASLNYLGLKKCLWQERRGQLVHHEVWSQTKNLTIYSHKYWHKFTKKLGPNCGMYFCSFWIMLLQFIPHDFSFAENSVFWGFNCRIWCEAKILQTKRFWWTKNA